MTISEWKQLEALKREQEEIRKRTRRLELADEENCLISLSNLLEEEYSDNPNFSQADNYLTNKIQQRFGEVTGCTDEVEEIIEIVCDYLGISKKELAIK